MDEDLEWDIEADWDREDDEEQGKSIEDVRCICGELIGNCGGCILDD